MADDPFDEWIAQRYETLNASLYDPAALGPTVDVLADLAGAGPALEFGIGTGRVALPLSARGLRVSGIDDAPAMLAQLRTHDGAGEIELTLGDYATTRVGGPEFALVYLVRNTITNLTTQDRQVDAFCNAAAHLRPGGCFVVENYIPELQRLPPGETRRVFAATPEHVAFEEYDVAAQIAHSHHYWMVEGAIHRRSAPFRYVWPGELDLMARLAGLRLRERWADWTLAPFASDSRSHVSVWAKPGDSVPAG
jgi:SAM-dependent methyltransferase